MTVTIATSNGNRTLTWQVTAPIAKMDNGFNDAGEYWYTRWFQMFDGDGDPILWDSLTLAQKREVLNAAYKKITKEAARSKYIVGETDDARETATTESETRYELNDPA